MSMTQAEYERNKAEIEEGRQQKHRAVDAECSKALQALETIRQFFRPKEESGEAAAVRHSVTRAISKEATTPTALVRSVLPSLGPTFKNKDIREAVSARGGPPLSPKEISSVLSKMKDRDVVVVEQANGNTPATYSVKERKQPINT